MGTTLLGETEGRLLLLNPIQFFKELGQVSELVNGLEHSHVRRHRRPLVRGIFSDIYTNIVRFVEDPTWGHFVALYIDWSSYGLMPLEGGYQACEAHSKYNQDKNAY